jgi:hypothetical protein
VFLCASLLTALLFGVWSGTAQAAPGQPSVLILLPGQPGLPAATAIASGVRADLLTEWAFRVSIEMEHVDVARFASPDVEERRLRAVYGSKYRDQRFDVIITALPEPFQFVLRARDELWPGTPVVVCGVDERSVHDLKPPPGFAVLTTRFDTEGTVRAALALLPDYASRRARRRGQPAGTGLPRSDPASGSAREGRRRHRSHEAADRGRAGSRVEPTRAYGHHPI